LKLIGPAEAAQGASIPRNEAPKATLKDRFGEFFGGRKAKIEGETADHAKETAGKISEGKALIDRAKGHMSAEDAAVAAKDQAGKTVEQKKAEIQKAEEMRKKVTALVKLSARATLSAEDYAFLQGVKAGEQPNDQTRAALAIEIQDARAEEQRQQEALTKVRGEKPGVSLSREQQMSEQAEEHQVRQVAHGERILAILSGSEGGKPTIDDLRKAAAICDSLGAEGRAQARLLDKVAQSLGERYPGQKAEIDGLRTQISGEVTAARESVRIPGAEDVLAKITPEARATAAQGLEAGATQIIRPEYQQKLREKLGITRTETPVEGGEPTVEYGVQAGSLAERRQNAAAFAQELDTAYNEAFAKAQEDPRLADLVVQLGQMRSIAESATRIMDQQIQRAIKETEVDQAAQIAKEKAGAERSEQFNKLAGRVDGWINKAGRNVNKWGSRATNLLGHGVAAVGAVAMVPGALIAGAGEGLAWVSRSLGAKAEGSMAQAFEGNEQDRQDKIAELQAQKARIDAELAKLGLLSTEEPATA